MVRGRSGARSAEAADELGQLRRELALPRLRLGARARLKAQPPRRRRVEVAGEGDRIEPAILESTVDARQRTDVRRRGRRRLRPGRRRRRARCHQPRRQAAEFATRYCATHLSSLLA